MKHEARDHPRDQTIDCSSPVTVKMTSPPTIPLWAGFVRKNTDQTRRKSQVQSLAWLALCLSWPQYSSRFLHASLPDNPKVLQVVMVVFC